MKFLLVNILLIIWINFGFCQSDSLKISDVIDKLDEIELKNSNKIEELKSEVLNNKYFILIEPKIFKNNLGRSFNNSSETIISPSKLTDLGVFKYRQEEYSQLNISWKIFKQEASKNGDILYKKINAKNFRDEKGILLYIYFSSKNNKSLKNSLHTILLGSEFYKDAKNKFGKKFNFLIPSQDKMYVYPSFLPKEQTDPIFRKASTDFVTSDYPASKEIFEYSEYGIKPIGILNID